MKACHQQHTKAATRFVKDKSLRLLRLRNMSSKVHAVHGCSSACKFVNICEFVSGICEFYLEKRMPFYIPNVFSTIIMTTRCVNSITNLPISIDNLRFFLEVCTYIPECSRGGSRQGGPRILGFGLYAPELLST